MQLLEHETLTAGQVLEIFSPVHARPTRGSYTGYGKRLPSDRPPVLTPKEMALASGRDRVEQPRGNGQALNPSGDGAQQALGPSAEDGLGGPGSFGFGGSGDLGGSGSMGSIGYGLPPGPEDGRPGGPPPGTPQ
jgi:hypothetical protein